MREIIAVCTSSVRHNKFIFPVHVSASAVGDRRGVGGGEDKDLFVDDWESTAPNNSDWYCQVCNERAIPARGVGNSLYHVGRITAVEIKKTVAVVQVRSITGESRKVIIISSNMLTDMTREDLLKYHLFFVDYPKNPKYLAATDTTDAIRML
jgi:hypothetical protein